jgi:hypothetical protein
LKFQLFPKKKKELHTKKKKERKKEEEEDGRATMQSMSVARATTFRDGDTTVGIVVAAVVVATVVAN